MDMSSMSSMPSSMMTMAFYTSTSTPLYSAAWTPRSTGAYAGTCIFLILLATLFRSLFAVRYYLERRWLDKDLNRRYVVVAAPPSSDAQSDSGDEEPATEAARVRDDRDAKSATLLTVRGVEEEVRVVKRTVRAVPAWRFSVDFPRAILGTVTVGIGYLLMLAVMTYNVGYFLSVLGGAFIGELVAGRFVLLHEH
ncbi:MAG: Oxysterol binding protein [Chaenotheca gracillima]|nr:MAG: Oxysterol binding protein [Chaenotheca gracillima]